MLAAMSTGSLSLGHELDVRVAEARGGLSGNDERILGLPARAPRRARVPHRGVARAGRRRVSAAAVVRFSRRLGFASFRELRDRARDELQADRADGAAVVGLGARAQGRARHRQPRGAAAAARRAARSRRRRRSPARARRGSWPTARRTASPSTRSGCCTRCARTSGSSIPRSPTRCASLGADDVVVACTFRPYARLTLRAHGATRARRARGSWSSPTAARTTSSTPPTSCSPSRSRARRSCCRSRPPCASWRRWSRSVAMLERRPHARDARGDGRVRRRAGPRRRARADDRDDGQRVHRAAAARATGFRGRGQGHDLDEGPAGDARLARVRGLHLPRGRGRRAPPARGGRRDHRPHDQPGAVLPRRHPVRAARRHAQPVRPRRGSRAARAAARAPPSPPAPCRWPSAPTAAARSASRVLLRRRRPQADVRPGARDARASAAGRRCRSSARSPHRRRRADAARDHRRDRTRAIRAACGVARAADARVARRASPRASTSATCPSSPPCGRRSAPRSASCAPPGGAIDDAEPEPIRERAAVGRDRGPRGLRRRPRRCSSARSCSRTTPRGCSPPARRLRGGVPRRARRARALRPRVGALLRRLRRAADADDADDRVPGRAAHARRRSTACPSTRSSTTGAASACPRT